jgi:prolyl 4-hydroxylase
MGKMNRSQQRKGVGTLALFMLALLSLLLLVFLLVGLVAVPSSPDSQLRNGAKLELKLHLSQLHVHQGESGSKPWVEVLSWEPRAFLYHKFLTPEECTHLIDLAKPSMIKSTVVDSATGKSKDSRVRTSSGTFLTRGQDKIIKTIEQRIADFTFIPVGKSKGRCVSVSPDCFAEPVTQ